MFGLPWTVAVCWLVAVIVVYFVGMILVFVHAYSGLLVCCELLLCDCRLWSCIALALDDLLVCLSPVSLCLLVVLMGWFVLWIGLEVFVRFGFVCFYDCCVPVGTIIRVYDLVIVICLPF